LIIVTFYILRIEVEVGFFGFCAQIEAIAIIYKIKNNKNILKNKINKIKNDNTQHHVLSSISIEYEQAHIHIYIYV